MKAGFAASLREELRDWTRRNERLLLLLSMLSLVVAFFGFLLTSTIKILPGDLMVLVNIGAVVFASLIILSVAAKGLVPIVISILGVVLIHNAIILPLSDIPEGGEAILRGQKVIWTFYSSMTVEVAGVMHFSLGISMVIFAMIIAHRPSTLFARNRPVPEEDEWSKYPHWNDNAVLADGRSEQTVPIKNMMTEQDRHLLWRYEFVLASIYGSLHLVRPEGMVPRDSTMLLRDSETGRLFGKARFGGFFF